MVMLIIIHWAHEGNECREIIDRAAINVFHAMPAFLKQKNLLQCAEEKYLLTTFAIIKEMFECRFAGYLILNKPFYFYKQCFNKNVLFIKKWKMA